MNMRQMPKTKQVLLCLLTLLIAPVTARADITTGLQVRYRFDDTGSSAADSSNNGNTGTLGTGASFNAGGRIGGCVELDGSTGYVDCPTIAATSNASQLTIAFWVKTVSREDYEMLCSKYKDLDELFNIQIGA